MATRGRHRRYRPSPVSRASLTVTAGGAGIALPLIGVGHVQAAPVDTWEKVAACESSGRWHVNTGNGHFGGLQFKQSTWESYGGAAYAARADQATKAEQIAVAEKVLAGQGPGAWPACSPRAGLTRDMAQPHAEGSGAARPLSQRATIRQPATARPPAQAEPGGQEHERGSQTHDVARGDSLSSIATDHGVRGGWQALYERNRPTVGEDPNLIFPGQRLHLTGTAPRGEAAPERTGGTQGEAAPERTGGTRGEAAPERTEKKAAPEKSAEKSAPEAEPRPAEANAAPAKPAKPGKAKEQRAEAAGQQADRKAADRRKSAPSYTAPVSGAGPGTAYRKAGGAWSSGYHTGVDFAVATGTKVQAVTSATVASAGWAGAYGYQVVLRHHDGRFSQYAHLSAISVRPGQRVNTGQTVGRSGNTGNSTGPHLHFEIRTGPGYGSDMDPLAYLRQHGVTI
ncbi:transglycosylase family protein [Streptomyces sp. TRM 70351]|uniref:transglycosylase family protein n=1 Tax=Streptomyces sp. TRM 70351 TaxID=3116552 RepID=UPI002E7C509A|nr:transglycosylase family protein [Streptomyces sp. TRM 70351]MEE1927034.1 transglycosylase family protein [Streptomyces sp. TRM 70351]